MVAFPDRDAEELVGILRKTMDSIEIPTRGFDPNSQPYILNNFVYPFLENGPACEKGHNIRVALYGVCISSMLGFSERDARQKFRADIAHDNGKKPFFHLFEQAKTDEAVRQAIKFGHIAPENVVRIYGDDVSSAIEQHHIHQSIVPPYPRKLYFPKTPKSLLLSELMAILDFYDAVFSRPDKTTGQWLSPEEATKRTYQEYGNMVIHYTEPNFPNEVITGKKLLDALLEMRVIGRKAPSAEADVALRFNPFR